MPVDRKQLEREASGVSSKRVVRPMNDRERQNASNRASGFRGYVSCEFSKSDRVAFSQWRESLSDGELMQAIARVVGEGKRVSVGWKEDSFVASASDLDPSSLSVGYVLTAFGKDAMGAAQALIYKHDMILEGVWPTEDSDAYDVR